jgi:NADH:ubiquinone oxidoreductase subunit 3 (subunit A)
MSADDTWTVLFVYLLIAFSVGFLMLLGARVLRVRAKEVPSTRGMTYECGEEPEGRVWIRFHPRYYVVALIFVVFDVETVFLVPWAMTARSLGLFALVEMVIFAAILMLSWGYALRKGALEWQ